MFVARPRLLLLVSLLSITNFAAASPTPHGPAPSPSPSPSATPSASTTPLPPGAIDPKLFGGIKWRQVGPFRGGRAIAIAGVPGEPNTYYFGAVAGGVWKTTDGG